MADSVHREIVYAKGTDAALAFAQHNPNFTTHDLVKAVVDATWDSIKESKG